MKRISLKIISIICILAISILQISQVIAISEETVNQETEKIRVEKMLKSQANTQKTIKTVEGIEITSEKYLISELYSYIGRILPRTTVEQFKMTFNIASENIHIYKDATLKQEIQEGYIATNMVVKFNGVEKEYTVVVVGDFDGDGNTNQIEIQHLIKHILQLKGHELTGIKLLCADINKDGNVNQIDLNLLINYVVFGRLNVGEIRMPKSPLIQVATGKLADNGWYTTNVKIRITEMETEDKEKTTYKIDGPIQVEETTIPENEDIELKEDGIYKITSYTYSKDGVRSLSTSKIIKIDKTNSEVSTLTMKLNNTEGAIYITNTWTNQNVYIEAKEIEGSKVEYEVEGATIIERTEAEPIVISNEGISTVTLYTTNNIGNEIAKEYTIKIDKTAPQAPNVEITEGEKKDEQSEWYTENVSFKIDGGEDNLSGVEEVSYEIDGLETKIPDGTIGVDAIDGVKTIKCYTYDQAGNKSIAKEITIKKWAKEIPDLNINLEMRLNNEEGEIYTTGRWTNQNVYIKAVTGVEQIDEQTPINIYTTYTVIGNTTVANPTTEATIIENEGQSTVIVNATDEIGRTKTKEFIVNIDKTLPENSTITVEGTKLDSEYYNTDVGVTVAYGEDNLSGIQQATYVLEGAQTQTETAIQNEGKIIISEDGTTKVIIKTYDIAGNVNQMEQIIKRDTQAPENITIAASEITGTSYKLTATAQDLVSGIQKYDFYVDGNRYATIETGEPQASIDVTKQTSGIHNAYVIVTDNAENSNQSSRINVETAKLEAKEIDYMDFVITRFNSENNIDELDIDSVQGIVSDTSLTDESKYIQLAITQNGTMSVIEGKMQIVRKDGVVVDNTAYFPEEMIIETAHYSNGSGSTWNHMSIAEILGTKIYDGETNKTTPSKTVSIRVKDTIGNANNFKVTEKKIEGVNTYTRFTIKNVRIGTEKLQFKISQ